MPTDPGEQDGPVRFLTGLHGFFEACAPGTGAALAAQFGGDTAVDWIVVNPELFIERLTGRPFTPEPPSERPGDCT
ncbi:hypothetical protein ACH4FX_43135 [Streptomyces sp. NPDC018019]|uniref:hypothetical protein n=1 Tax=Streptomyces sp. NPDC018019 TaxID=3365030 RepID=UPI003797E430